MGEFVEHAGEVIPLDEQAVRKDGTFQIKVIAPGWGSSGYYPKDVLERDGPKVFKAGTKMYWDHPKASDDRERPERSLRDLAGELTGPAVWKEDGLYAPAKVFAAYRDMVKELAPHIGVSIRASGKGSTGEAEGRKGMLVEELATAKSVDFVTMPGAGGKVMEMFEAARDAEPTEAELAELEEIGNGNNQYRKDHPTKDRGVHHGMDDSKLLQHIRNPGSHDETVAHLKDAHGHDGPLLKVTSDGKDIPDMAAGLTHAKLHGEAMQSRVSGAPASAGKTAGDLRDHLSSEHGINISAPTPMVGSAKDSNQKHWDQLQAAHEIQHNVSGPGTTKANVAHGHPVEGPDHKHSKDELQRMTHDEFTAHHAEKHSDMPRDFSKHRDVHGIKRARKLDSGPGSSRAKSAGRKESAGVHGADDRNVYDRARIQMQEAKLDELEEAQRDLTEARKELEEARTAQARAEEALLLRDARDIIVSEVAKTDLPEVTKRRVATALSRAEVPTKDGKLDSPALLTAITEAVKDEKEYLAAIGGSGRVTGLGATRPAADTKDADAAIERSLRAFGLSESAAKAAAEGRN